MLDENRIDDLTLFYQLLSRVHHGLKELCTSFAAYIKVRSRSVKIRSVLNLIVMIMSKMTSHCAGRTDEREVWCVFACSNSQKWCEFKHKSAKSISAAGLYADLLWKLTVLPRPLSWGWFLTL